jgi:pyridoxine/pyridoxamine 5'-phosphate oxidase
LLYVPEAISADGISLDISDPTAATSLYILEQHIVLSGTVANLQDTYAVRYFGSRDRASLDSVWLLNRVVGPPETSVTLVYSV